MLNNGGKLRKHPDRAYRIKLARELGMTLRQMEGCMDSSEYREQQAFDALQNEGSEQHKLEEAAKRRMEALKAKGKWQQP